MTYPVPTSLPVPPRAVPDRPHLAAAATRASAEAGAFRNLVPAVEQDPEAARRLGQQVQAGALASRLAEQLDDERQLRAIAESKLTDALTAAVRERAAGWRDAAAFLSGEVMAYRGSGQAEVATFGRGVVRRMQLRGVEESRLVVPAPSRIRPEMPDVAAA